MSVKSIKVENFTVFDKIAMDFSPGVNLFIGENGTGKTHLLKILYAASKTEIDAQLSLFDYDVNGNYVHTNNTFIEEIYPLFNSPSDGTLANLIKFNSISNDTANIIVEFFNKKAFIVNVSDMNFIKHTNHPGGKYKIIENDSIFIPAKDMLAHSGIENDFIKRRLPFDDTHINILNDLKVSKLREHDKSVELLINKLQDAIGGELIYKSGEYFINKENNELNISLEAEGYKKLAVIYRALETGYLQPGSILFWDEPESNINPKIIPLLVDVLFSLSHHGVQIFLSTHDYMFAKYFELKNVENNIIFFHSLYKTETGVALESNYNFRDLKNNPIIESFDKLMNEVFNNNLGD